jgi:hypothetical protein
VTDKKRREILAHPELGDLAARRILECVFVLAPDGTILHHHLEEMDLTEDDGPITYTMNGTAPKAERSRCQIIPPLVLEFDKLD